MSRTTTLFKVQLHSAVQIGGVNLGLNLATNQRTGLVMEWDWEDRALFVTYNKVTGIIPEANVALMIPHRGLGNGDLIDAVETGDETTQEFPPHPEGQEAMHKAAKKGKK